MKDIQEIFDRVQDNKKKLREMKSVLKDAFASSLELQKTLEELKVLKDKKVSTEGQIRGELPGEMEKIEDLTADIAADQELLSDVAISRVAKGEAIQITDERKNTYEPVFSVRFRKV